MIPKKGKERRGKLHCETTATRFWSKATRCGDDDCWEWQGRRDGQEYGRFDVHAVPQLAHRIAWELTHGPIPDGLCVLHHCDNPPCCNPAHLFLGARAVNNADMRQKGRQAQGDGHGSRLHPESRARGDRNGSRTHPARRARGERHSARIKEVAARGEEHYCAKLQEWQIPHIRSLAENGVPKTDIARGYGVSEATVRDIVRGKTWRHVTEEASK